ncbi:MAG TPA: hypothetical protein VNE16_06770 [Vicinamibacterales bacterium]|nr:hypothetical protein [Vicinamibacterales bacterium]
MKRTRVDSRFDEACALMDEALAGPFRRALVANVSIAATLGEASRPLRDSMRANVWTVGARRIDLAPMVTQYDRHTRQDGLHALHDWDGVADHVNAESIPVDVINYLIEKRAHEELDTAALAIALDYYFLYVLALLSLRIWDDGDADVNLDRVGRLLGELQGPNGSGHRFADDAETLILIATSHYELTEWGYDRLLERVRTLNRRHRLAIALGHAAAMGCHLRFGFEATYARDIVKMRDDNIADYPWLCFAVATLMDEYTRLRDEGVHGIERDALVEALLNGLSPDARAFAGIPPAFLAPHEAERARFLECFQGCRDDLLAEFERYRPSAQAYSPLSFFFNFSHNVLKGMAIDALLWGEPWRLTLNDLFTGIQRDRSAGEPKATLATRLMGYARANPHTIRGRLMPVIVYDTQAGHQAFAVTMRKLRE